MIGIIEKIDALKVAKVAFNIGVGRITKESEIDYFSGIKFLKKDDIIVKIYLGQYIRENKTNKEIKDIIKNAMNELVKCYKISKNI